MEGLEGSAWILDDMLREGNSTMKDIGMDRMGVEVERSWGCDKGNRGSQNKQGIRNRKGIGFLLGVGILDPRSHDLHLEGFHSPSDIEQHTQERANDPFNSLAEVFIHLHVDNSYYSSDDIFVSSTDDIIGISCTFLSTFLSIFHYSFKQKVFSLHSLLQYLLLFYSVIVIWEYHLIQPLYLIFLSDLHLLDFLHFLLKFNLILK